MLMIGAGLIALGITLFLLIGGFTPLPTQDEFSTLPVEVDFAAPELILEDLAGNSVSLRDYMGDVVLVNLWATWCPPCKEEMPVLQSFYERHQAEGFVLVGINQEEAAEVVKPFVANYGLTFPIWLDEDYLAQREFKTSNLPSSYLIDRDGKVRLMWVGRVSENFLEKNVTKFLE
jgi:thiol-disulfide isomerase/thioredoxin